ncbi:hypothetical protein [Neobacillus sp. CF12]|uniref:hypothetical protein n=1 Tax=Neobacillus sp. CF12 TaxID=3055864 RepID=UPI0025A099CC|nr:hypothetical protein [Neobacillus sp. CF12]MDM5326891.1 hypothetical protein [Neobacillus sp. CF12]
MHNKFIDLLLDKTASVGARIGPALRRYDSSDFKDALFRVANDLTDNKLIRRACGESLADIWIRTNHFDLDSLLNLQGIAKLVVLDKIMMKKPTWYKKFLKSGGEELTPKKFIDLLLDKTACELEREYAATLLVRYDSSEVKDALFRVANDLTDNKLIRRACGESLADIWIRTNHFDLDSLLNLQGIAKLVVLYKIMMKKPTWYKKFLKSGGEELTPKKFIDLLLDKTACELEREYAATLLVRYDSSEVKDALFRFANDLTDSEDIRFTCGESLADIWIRTNQFDLDSLLKLQDIAKVRALEIIIIEKETWYIEYLKRGGEELNNLLNDF